MQLVLNKFLVKSLSLKGISPQDIKPERNIFDLGLGVQYHPEVNDLFAVVFKINLIHSNEFELKAEYIAWFKTSEPITDEFKKSSFPKVNAPAIAFPFLRSFISTVTLNAGYSPALLPSVNFVNFKNKKSLK